MESRRTDLALEARELYQEQTLREPPGVDWKEEEQDGIHMTEVHIRTPKGAQEIGKPQGRYITFQLGETGSAEDHTIAAASSLLARQVRRLLPPDQRACSSWGWATATSPPMPWGHFAPKRSSSPGI